MKLALLADIHANRHALEACLAHAEKAGVERHAFLGDLVGYGAEPGAVVQTVMALQERGAIAIKGNHDLYSSMPLVEGKTDLGYASVAWTQQQLSRDERAFLANLPMTHTESSFLLVHASADSPERWRYVETPELAAASLDGAMQPPVGNENVRHVFGGHVHAQALFFRGGAGKLMPFIPTPGVPIPVPRHRLWLATVGSVGQPRDGNALAMYAIFDDSAQLLTFHRVPYDVQGAMAAIRATELPAFFADRLEQGR
ncbi:metallophosphoesterase family protein [Ottowia thiooxydans]|uniref:metallophosphoesterase family protein n=1 Tax=Ottowia thiooxydans TaxID=219182 RepID=UPI00049100D6|nr:metallophosphoesterase family protein [Ottowia thiooxydans]